MRIKSHFTHDSSLVLTGLYLNVTGGAHILACMEEQAVDPGECAKILKALGDETKLKIVQLLLKREKSVSEIVSSLCMAQPQAWLEPDEKATRLSILSIRVNIF